MKHTVIALFDSAETARSAAESLRSQGFAETSVHAGTTPAADAHPLPPASEIEGGPASGLLHRLAVLFGVDDEPHIDHYAEAVRRGGSLVHVEARDEAQATAARDALLALGAANIDDRIEQWQQRGWRARLDAARGRPAQGKTGAAAVTSTQAPATPSGQAVVTHRHEVSIGGVRVYGHAASPFENHVEAFRADYATRFAGSGHSYEEFESAYRHGHAVAADPRYGGRTWDDISGDVRGDWEQRHPGRAWETFKNAVRHARERALR
ncbi:MAG: hypothetical protein ABIS28_07490 [Caldimonas sp.]